jgi:hypothetical protein
LRGNLTRSIQITHYFDIFSNDLATQAQNAYSGQLDPSTGQSECGLLWIYGKLQRLAAFDARPARSGQPISLAAHTHSVMSPPA